MRLIADQSFLASIEQNRSLEVELVRWSAERVTDVDLLRECRSAGAGGVMFLGVQALVSEELLRVARDERLYLVATLETNPLVAARTVGNLLGTLAKSAKPGVCHVMLSRELREWEAEDLTSKIS